jgi:predicted Zn-dependent protease
MFDSHHHRTTTVILAAVAATLLLGSAPARAQFLNKLLQGVGENLPTIVQNADKLLGNYTEEEERRIGGGVAEVLLGAAPLHPSKEVQRYVNTLGTWIALHTERPQLRWHFAVLDDPAPNALAAPGGYIFVTRGLLAVMRNETELAGVLAHEISHVLAKHHLEAITSQERFSLALDVLKSATDTKGALGDALAGLTKQVYKNGLDHADEYQADRMGVVIAARSGYDAYGLNHALMTLDALSGNAQLMTFFNNTHPRTQDRIDQLFAVLDGRFDQPRRPPAKSFARMQSEL